VAESPFDANIELSSHLVTGNPIVFTMAANFDADFSYHESQWQIFTSSAFVSSLNIDYYSLTFFSSRFESQQNGAIITEEISCSNSTLSNMFVLGIQEAVDISITCDGHDWSFVSGRMCVDCVAADIDVCTEETILAVIPPNTACNPALKGRVASAFYVSFDVIPPAGIPQLNDVSASSSRTTVTITANVTTFASGCTLFCAVFAHSDNAPAVNIGQIKQNGVSTFVQTPGDNQVIIATQTVSNLIPVVLYEVYCYTESVEDFGITLDAVLVQKVILFTQCCRSISFTNAPTLVLNDVTTYSATDPLSKYVFSYSVGAAPDYSVDITPTLYKNTSGVLTNTSGLSQGLTTYFPDSALTSSFLLSYVPDLTNTNLDIGPQVTYLIGFEIDGDDAFMYDAPLVPIVVGNGETEPPPPQFLSAVIFSTGAKAILTFDSETDEAVSLLNATTWSCSLLFSFNGASQCTCTFSSNTVITITFPPKSQISATTSLLLPNQEVVLRASSLKALCTSSSSVCATYSFVPSMSIVVSAPVIPTTPTVKFSMPAVISNCDNLRVDISGSFGSAGRPFSVLSIQVTASDGVAVDSLQSNISQYFETSGLSGTYLIDNSFLTSATYTFQLTLTNWLGQTTTGTASVLFSTEGDLPTLTISGSTFITKTAAEAISVSAVASLSSCSKATGLVYDPWKVYLDFVFVNGRTSASKDPKKFTLPAYTLSAGNTYQLQLTTKTVPPAGGVSASATASATIYVDFGVVTVIVTGGLNRQIPVDTVLKLDATQSQDTSFSPSSQADRLSFLWNCKELDAASFGASCSELIQDRQAGFSTVPAESFQEGSQYEFTIKCTSTDGTQRTSSQTILVTGSAGNTPTVTVLTTITKFNPADSLKIIGFIEANLTANPSSTVSGEWNASGFSNLNTIALVPTFREFSGVDALQVGVTFQLLFGANSFEAGKTYTFTLSAFITAAATSSSQLLLEVNSPPSSGSFNVTPRVGIATGSNSSTQFFFTLPDWLDEDLPLTYEMLYYTNVNDPSATFTIQAKGLSTIAFANLPSGIESSNFEVFSFAYVRDSLTALTQTDTATVSVQLDAGISSTEAVANVLADSLSTALSTTDSNAVAQVVNAAATTLSSVNCSLATNCESLFRSGCTITAQTCGPCLSGFVGEDGDANTACISTVRRHLWVERVLAANPACPADNIWYFNSSDPDCAPFPRKCLSDSTAVCSGHGQCVYQDVSGNVRSSCTVIEQFCSAVCVCDAGFGGATCGFALADITSRIASRLSMCDAIVFSSGTQDNSPELLLSMASSLAGVYSPLEQLSQESIASCSTVMELIYELLLNDQLDGTDQTTQVVLNAISSLTTTMGVSPGNAPGNFSTILISTVDMLVENVVKFMIPGQTLKTFTTSNIQLTVFSSFVSETASASLLPPQTVTQQSLALPSTKLVLPDGGWDQCVSDSDSISYSILTWNQNPFSNSTEISSPLLHIQLLNASAKPSSLGSSTSSTYSVVFQLNQPQNGNMNQSDVFENRTIPGCARREDDTYGGCNCNVSAYTTTNVTLTCFDVTDLCGGEGASGITSFLAGKLDNSFGTVAAPLKLSSRDGVEIGHRRGAVHSRRRLAESGEDSTSNQFGLLFTAVAAEARAVLSTNPNKFAALGRASSIPVLAFMACLVGTFVVGCVVCIRTDESERCYLTYVENAKVYAGRMETGSRGASSALFRAFSAKSLRGNIGSPADRKADGSVKSSKNGNRDSEEVDDDVPLFDKSEKLVETEVDSVYVNQVDSFFGNVVFKGSDHLSIIDKGRFWEHYWASLSREHLLLAPFSYPSTSNPRLGRWIEVFVDLLLNMCIFALFFSIFYPGEADCGAFSTLEECEFVIVQATGKSQCEFDATLSPATCTEREFEETPEFFLILTLVVGAITLPLLFPSLMVIGIIQTRPDLDGYDEWPWSIIKFAILGTRGTNDVITDSPSVERPSMLKAVMEKEQSFKKVARATMHSVEGIRRAATDNFSSAIDNFSSAVDSNVKKVRKFMGKGNKHISGSHFFNKSMTERLKYVSTLSSKEEAELLVEDAVVCLTKSIQTATIPWYSAVDQPVWKDDNHLEAIETLLRIYPDGSMMPLTWWDSVIRGYQSPMDRVIKKVRSARAASKKLDDKIEEFSRGEADLKDKLILQSFVLENLNSIDSAALKKSFFNFDMAARTKSPLHVWIFGWCFVVGELLLFIYFALAWAVSNNPSTVRLFFIAFALDFAQVMFLFEPLRVFFNFTIPLATMKPLLRKIYHVLNNIMTSPNNLDEDGEADQALQIVQFLSPTCRAARSDNCSDLPAASFLVKLTDSDSAKCLHKSNAKGWLLTLLLALPAVYAMAGEMRGDEIFNFIVQVVYTFIVLLNDIILSFSVPLAVCIYFLVVSYFLFKYGVYKPMKAKVLQGLKLGSGEKLWGSFEKGDELYWDTENLSRFSLYKQWLLKFIERLVSAYVVAAGGIHKRDRARIWRNMNKPHHCQCQVLSEAEYEHYAMLTSTDVCKDTNIPEFISKLRGRSEFDAYARGLLSFAGSDAPTHTWDSKRRKSVMVSDTRQDICGGKCHCQFG